MTGDAKCFINQRFVFNDIGKFYPAGSRHQGFWFCIINTDRQLIRGEASKNHRVNRSKPGTSQHCDHCFRNHRHVDDDPVSFFNPLVLQHPGKTGNFVQQFTISVTSNGFSDRGIINQSRLLGPPVFHMEIEGQVTRVEFSSLEPVIKTLFILREDRLRFLIPSDQFGVAAPECFRILNGFAVFFLVAHVFPS